jgi:hypothetical protein
MWEREEEFRTGLQKAAKKASKDVIDTIADIAVRDDKVVSPQRCRGGASISLPPPLSPPPLPARPPPLPQLPHTSTKTRSHFAGLQGCVRPRPSRDEGPEAPLPPEAAVCHVGNPAAVKEPPRRAGQVWWVPASRRLLLLLLLFGEESVIVLA